MLPKRLTEIDDAYLYSLIANQVEESKTLDYKRTLPRTSDGDRIEFLADVFSFAVDWSVCGQRVNDRFSKNDIGRHADLLANPRDS